MGNAQVKQDTQSTIALLGSLLFLNSSFNAEETANAFQLFKQKYNKRYGSTEEAYRFAIYTQNVLYAKEFNLKKGREVFGETKFFDLTDEEFAQTYLTLKVDEEEESKQSRVTPHLNKNLAAVDWVAKGAVTRVQDQGECGGCWTFGATGVLEGHYFVNDGILPDLSEQQLLDCSTWADLNFGCNGGMPSRALNYVKRNGITLDAEYPYTAVQGSCAKKGGEFKTSGHQAIAQNEDALIAAIQQQPVSVGVNGSNWKYYDPSTSRIFSDCEETGLNHAVLAVGYDGESIKIKNQWGTGWGVEGYIYLARGGNTCGVQTTAIIPI